MTNKKRILTKINSISPKDKIDQILKISEEKLSEDIKLSLVLVEEAKILSEEHFYTAGLTNSLIQLGKIHQKQSNYGEAMKAALQAMELCSSLNDIKGEATCLDILGGVYNFLGDYHKRLDCNLKCLALREKANDISAQLSTTNNIGDTYMIMGDYHNAIKYFERCLSFKNLDNHIQAIVYYNIGEVYYNLKNYRSAKENINKGLKFGEACNYWQIILASFILQSRIFIDLNKNNDAIILLKKAEILAIKKNNKEEEYTLYRYFADAYGNLNEYENAYTYLNKYNLLKDELLNDNNAQKLKKIEFEFQFKNIKSEAKETKKKNKLLTRAFNQIENQRDEIKLKNLSITDSIRYAKRIQSSILPSSKRIQSVLKNSFVFYKPKDIVSGDFYWIDKVGDHVIFSVIDCTGHGVPGAFVSLIAHNALNKVILENLITNPALILTEINQLMISSFQKSNEIVRDGMDMGLCSWNIKTNKVEFSGAYHSLFIRNGSEVSEIKGNRESIGHSLHQNKIPFTNHQIQIKQDTVIYLSSDGFPDQFGGKKGKKLKWKQFKNLLSETNNINIQNQKELLSSFLTQWKGDLEQVDDICVLGVQF